MDDDSTQDASEEATTLTKHNDTADSDGGADSLDGTDSSEDIDAPGPVPGLGALLGQNRRGKLHEVGPGMIIDGKWDLQRLLGEGTFGQVYEAWHVQLQQSAAIKILLDEHSGAEAKQRFLAEAQLMAGMSSEHLVRASDYGELPDGSSYFVMDLVKGKSLRQWLRSRLSLWRAMEIGEEILEGLVEVHQRGVVHGDIKPENVVIGEDDDKARLLDFGLAQTSAAGRTEVGGTLHYMAPEMLFDKEPASVRTDVYAVGVVLYEMLTGRLPHGHIEMDFAKLRAAWVGKPTVDPVRMHCKRGDLAEGEQDALNALDELVIEMLAREPTARPRSAAPVLEVLRRCKSRLSPKGVAPVVPGAGEVKSDATAKTTLPHSMMEPETVERPRRRVWPVVLASMVMVAVVIGWRAWPKDEVVVADGPQVEAGFGVTDVKGARDGVLVVVPEDADSAVAAGYDAVCTALGGRRPLIEGMLSVLCVRVPGPEVEGLMDLAEDVSARVVVLVGGGEVAEIEVRSTSHDQGNQVLARLDRLRLPAEPAALAQVAPVLNAVVGMRDSTEFELEVLDWQTVGARWGVLSEWLRMQQGHDAHEDLLRRQALARALERMRTAARRRGAGEDDGIAYYRDLAMLVWATSMNTCANSEPILRELRAAGVHKGIRVAAILEHAACLVDGPDAGSRVDEASALIAQAAAASDNRPCVLVAAIGTISLIDRWRGNDELWRANEARLPTSLGTCGAGTWSRGFAVRGDALVERERWCDATQAYARAYGALRTKLKPLLNWAEYQWLCTPSVAAVPEDLLRELSTALASEGFRRAEQRVSIAYLRWWLTRTSGDAQRVLGVYAGVKDGEVALLEGVASDLEGEICGGVEGDGCSLRILARGKRGDDEGELRRSFGL